MTAEHLTDGREPDLPVSDSLLRRLLFNLAAFREVPARAGGGRGDPAGGQAARGHWAAMAAVRLIEEPELPAVGCSAT